MTVIRHAYQYYVMPLNDRDFIAAEVRAELARQQKSQRDVAEILGVDQGSVSLRLSGARAFRAEELAALAAALKVPVSRFYGEPASSGQAPAA